MWHLGTWFSGGLGSVRFMVGLDDLKGLFQPKRFYDSMRDALNTHWQACPYGTYETTYPLFHRAIR